MDPETYPEIDPAVDPWIDPEIDLETDSKIDQEIYPESDLEIDPKMETCSVYTVQRIATKKILLALIATVKSLDLRADSHRPYLTLYSLPSELGAWLYAVHLRVVCLWVIHSAAFDHDA
jgi:hypothetical protein